MDPHDRASPAVVRVMPYAFAPLLATLLCAWGVAALHAQTVTVEAGGPITETYAFLEHGRNPVPLALVKRIDRTFTRLEAKCRQTRDSKPRDAGLADASVTAVQGLRKAGVRIGYRAFLEQLEAAIPSDTRHIDCIQVVATMWALLEKHKSRSDASRTDTGGD